jgi:GNAT superfamily N-acetyltransferase
MPGRVGAHPGAHRPGGRPLTARHETVGLELPTTLTVDGMPVELRRATAADLPALVALLADDPLGAARETADGDLAPYRRAFDLLDADPAHVLVAAVDGDVLVGTLQLTFLPGLARRGALRAQIEAVRVAAGARGRGLGAAMIGWAVGEARRRGCGLVQLTTDKSRADAHRFYAGLGFIASHEGMKLQLPGSS